MVIFCNADGTLNTVIPNPITQGSNGFSSIVFVCDALSEFSAVNIDFTLPNGQRINGGIMIKENVFIGNKLHATYRAVLKNNVTNFPGKVDVGFSAVDPMGNVLKTYLSSFTVVKTNSVMLPEVPSNDWYNEILSAYAILGGKIGTGELESKGIHKYDENFIYSNGTLVYDLDTDGVLFLARSLSDDNLANPLDDTNNWVEYKFIKNFNDFVEEVNETYQKKNYDILVEQTVVNLNNLMTLWDGDELKKVTMDNLKKYLTQSLVGLRFEIYDSFEDLPPQGMGNIIYLVPTNTVEEYDSFSDFPEVGVESVIYLDKSTGLFYVYLNGEYVQYNNIYLEYIYLEEMGKYESFGTTALDLELYATIKYVDTNKVDKTQIVSAWSETVSDTKIPSEKLVQETFATKEDNLPTIPEFPENFFLGLNDSGEKIWQKITPGGGGYNVNIYLSNDDSDVETYKKLKTVIDPVETEISKTANNTSKLMGVFLFDNPLGVLSIDAGNWGGQIYCKVDNASNTTRFKFEPFLYHIDTTETVLFEAFSEDINNTSYAYVNLLYNTGIINVAPTDRLGVKISMVTNRTSPTTLSFKIGNGYATFVTTPLALRHSQLRGLNEDPYYQHISTEEKNSLAKKNASNLSADDVKDWQDKLLLKVKDFTLLSNSPAVTISELDLVGDGGEYDILISSSTNETTEVFLYLNDDRNGNYSEITLNAYNGATAPTIISALFNQQFYCGVYNTSHSDSVIKLMVKRANRVFYKNSSYSTATGSSSYFRETMGNKNIANVTSFTIYTVATDSHFNAGTRIQVYKRG